MTTHTTLAPDGSDLPSVGTQRRRILDHLRTGQTLTARQAWRQLGVARLSARVFDLRQQGHPIRCELVPVPTRDGSTARVARYSLTREETTA